jgi:hypothetical protein
LHVAVAQFGAQNAQQRRKKMSGTLTFRSNHIPKRGEQVLIFVSGKDFPTGIWKGILIYVQGLDGFNPHNSEVEFHTFCQAEIVDERAPSEWRGLQPEGHYEVYLDAPGMDILLNKFHEKRAEVKSLKKELSLTEKIYGKLLAKLLGPTTAKEVVAELEQQKREE